LVEEITWTIPLKDGVFLGLLPDWSQSRWLPPEPNSVQWVLARLNGRQGESDSVQRAKDNELQSLLARVVELLPTVHEGHWWQVCQAAALLAERGAKDPRILHIVRDRYLEPQLSAGEATQVLSQYDLDGSQELIAKRIWLEFDLARKSEAIKEQYYVGGWDCLSDLFDQLDVTFAERNELIVAAMDHPHAGVRHDGYERWDELPEPLARLKLEKGLVDPSPSIREDCASAIAENFGSPEVQGLLRVHRAVETDGAVIDAIDTALKRLD
jgi:hypothetical protein